MIGWFGLVVATIQPQPPQRAIRLSPCSLTIWGWPHSGQGENGADSLMA